VCGKAGIYGHVNLVAFAEKILRKHALIRAVFESIVRKFRRFEHRISEYHTRKALLELERAVLASSKRAGLTASILKQAFQYADALERLQKWVPRAEQSHIAQVATQISKGKLERDLFNSDRSRAPIWHLRHGSFKFPEKNSAWVLSNEILVNEDYFFETESPRPLILDGGSHVGLSIWYLKQLHPSARIIGFEPDPEIRDIALQNIEATGLEDVELLPYALAGHDGPIEFFSAQNDSMASNLTRRSRPNEQYTRRIVEGKRLSGWLNMPVDLLKLDIEGAEDEVIAECGEALRNVNFIFIEYHQDASSGSGRLATILGVLDSQGFTVNVGKSWGHQARTQYRPFSHVLAPYSGVIWARNTCWNQSP